MKNFIKKNWFGVVMAVGTGAITWLVYKAGTYDGWLECYEDCIAPIGEALTEATKETTE